MTYTVFGTVTDETGHTVENATVILRNYNESSFDLSDENGLFDFSDVKSGKYELCVLHRNHKSLREIVDVAEDIDIDIYLTLE